MQKKCCDVDISTFFDGKVKYFDENEKFLIYFYETQNFV